MPRYQVRHSYAARRDGQDFGPWVDGDEVDLTVDDADWVNRDSPGTLASKAEPKPAEREPAKDRQQRGGRAPR